MYTQKQQHQQIQAPETGKPIVKIISSIDSSAVPSLQTRKIIKITSQNLNQINWVRSIKQVQIPAQAVVPSFPIITNSLLSYHEKACGRFNSEADSKFDVNSFINTEYNSYTSVNLSDESNGFEAIDMETNINFNFLNESLFSPIDLDSSIKENQFENTKSSSINSPKMTSKFAQKVKDANLKIKVVPPQTNFTFSTSPTNDDVAINLSQDQLNKLITPSIEEMCMKLDNFESSRDVASPTGELNLEDLNFLLNDEEQDACSFESLLLSLATPTLSPKKANPNQNPFVCSKETEKQATSPILNLVNLDHFYVSQDKSQNKRKMSTIESEDTMDSDVFGEPSGSQATGSTSSDGNRKKQRTKGIYRYDDVTNAEEYQNYVERRKKNNISSKVSRANKKKHYDEMDARSDRLERENKNLALKITKLEEATKLIKDHLIQSFADRLK